MVAILADFFGADEALTTYSPNAKEWVATLLCKADTQEDLAEKRDGSLHKIAFYTQHELSR